MKQILVYENWLRTAPTRIGTLFVEAARGKEVCSFEYDNEWLKHSGSFVLDPDLSLFKGRQFAPVGKELFGSKRTRTAPSFRTIPTWLPLRGSPSAN